MKYIYEVGDIVQLKKKHPCGSTEWQILRVGADFKLKCTGCGHEIMVSRTMVEKNTKNFSACKFRLTFLRGSAKIVQNRKTEKTFAAKAAKERRTKRR